MLRSAPPINHSNRPPITSIYPPLPTPPPPTFSKPPPSVAPSPCRLFSSIVVISNLSTADHEFLLAFDRRWIGVGSTLDGSLMRFGWGHVDAMCRLSFRGWRCINKPMEKKKKSSGASSLFLSTDNGSTGNETGGLGTKCPPWNNIEDPYRQAV